MKLPRKSTVEYVYAKLKIEVIKLINSEIDLNHDTDGDVYGFDAQEKALYDVLCEDMIRAIEQSEINYESLCAAMETYEKTPF